MKHGRKRIKKVVSGLQKASKTHARQAKTLSSVLAGQPKKRKKSNAKK